VPDGAAPTSAVEHGSRELSSPGPPSPAVFEARGDFSRTAAELQALRSRPAPPAELRFDARPLPMPGR
jgi:hypothetical protein